MADDADRTAYLTFTVTKEYSLELDFPEMAKVLGVNRKKLIAMIEDGEDFEPSDAAAKRMVKHAEEQSDDLTVDDIGES